MARRPKPESNPGPLHFSAITPGSSAVAMLLDQDGADLSDLRWELPDGCLPGEIIFHVAAGDTLAIVGRDVLIDGPGSEDGLDLQSGTVYLQGLSVKAVEKRLGYPFPSFPCTVDSSRSAEVLSAVEAESASPTSWRKIEPATSQSRRAPEGAHLSYGCPACDRTEISLETHDLTPGLPGGVVASVEVCRSCHDLLHAPLSAEIDDLIGRNRPPCPSCSATRPHRVQWGFPPFPVPPGYEVAGCALRAVPEDFSCPACGLWWSEDDTYFPLMSTVIHHPRVRARVADTGFSDSAEQQTLREPGRLVFGRIMVPPEDAPARAWDTPPSCCELVGDDGRVYLVERESVRGLDHGADGPEPDHRGPIASGTETDATRKPRRRTKIVRHAGPELYEVLDADPGQVTLASPFISIAVAQELARRATLSDHSWYLLTRSDPSAAAGGFLSLDGLQLLLDAGVEITNCPNLHAKAFVVGRRFGLLGSANLTSAGLGFSSSSNHELSVRLEGTAVRRLQKKLDRLWESGSNLGQRELDQLRKRTEALPPPPLGPRTASGAKNDQLAGVVRKIVDDARGVDATLWVKSVESTPSADDWDPSGWFSSHSANRPGFVAGDLVLLYSKEAGGCVGVLEVLDEPRYDPGFVGDRLGAVDGQRWPWVNTAVPRLMPLGEVVVPGSEMGISTRGLQQGRVHIGVEDFEGVVRTLAAGCAVAPDDEITFLG